MAGYSGTPLVKKLGIKEGFIISIINNPANYRELIGVFPNGVYEATKKSPQADFIHFFVKSKNELSERLPGLKKQLKPDGMIWISWYKKSSGITTDVSEELIRAVALPLGLVDVKVCAVDEQWSGLKLVIRKENRK
ncbi:MAG: hypothetical protein ACHQD9_06435 [Chitinophagales bacterium]